MAWLVRLVARLFFRACGKWPGLFALAMLSGLGVGFWLLFVEEPKPDQRLAVWGMGLGCLTFYGSLLAVQIVKVRRGTWVQFCERCAAEFE
jgi:hypothetical protein